MASFGVSYDILGEVGNEVEIIRGRETHHTQLHECLDVLMCRWETRLMFDEEVGWEDYPECPHDPRYDEYPIYRALFEDPYGKLPREETAGEWLYGEDGNGTEHLPRDELVWWKPETHN